MHFFLEVWVEESFPRVTNVWFNAELILRFQTYFIIFSILQQLSEDSNSKTLTS